MFYNNIFRKDLLLNNDKDAEERAIVSWVIMKLQSNPEYQKYCNEILTMEMES